MTNDGCSYSLGLSTGTEHVGEGRDIGCRVTGATNSSRRDRVRPRQIITTSTRRQHGEPAHGSPIYVAVALRMYAK